MICNPTRVRPVYIREYDPCYAYLLTLDLTLRSKATLASGSLPPRLHSHPAWTSNVLILYCLSSV